MNEPRHLMTFKTAERFTEESDDFQESLLEHEAEARIVEEEFNGVKMFEGVINVYLETHRFDVDADEYQDSATFRTFDEALVFINTCLDEWGFDFTFIKTDFLRTIERRG